RLRGHPRRLRHRGYRGRGAARRRGVPPTAAAVGGEGRGVRVRQPAERPRVGALLGQVLPDRDPLHRLRRRGGLPLSLGGDLPAARDVRLRRDGDLRARAGARLRLRLAPGRAPPFEVVYQLYSVSLNHRLRVKVQVPEDDPVVPTAAAVWKSANWAEREVWDMFGIRFAGHPDLRRILMYPEFEGHPLRKD